jgi:F-type H+-transporting ATPase subunit b
MDTILQIFEQFGVTWPKFIAQTIIFIVVYWFLAKFAFGPIVNVLDERRRRIAEAQDNAEKVKQQLADAEKRYAEILAKADAEAKSLIDEARASAEAVRERRVQEAVAEAEGVVRKAHESIEQDRRKMEAEVKSAMVSLVAATTSKVTGKVLTADDQKRLNEETIKEIAA